MPRFVSFSLKRPFGLLNERDRQHFAVRKRAQRALMLEIASVTIGQRPAPPFRYASVYIQRLSVGRPDLDGLYGGAKSLLDCLTTPALNTSHQPGRAPSVRNPLGLGFIVDDGPDHILLKIVPIHCRRSDQCTVVWIEEMEAPAFLAQAPNPRMLR